MRCPVCGYDMKDLSSNIYKCNTKSCDVSRVQIYWKQPTLDKIIEELRPDTK